MKLKILSSAFSLVVLCSAPIVNAESLIAGQLVANPSVTIIAGEIEHKVGAQTTSYIEGDKISTDANSNAKISLVSGLANIIVAPNTVMSVTDASQTDLSLIEGAISVDAKAGQIVSVETASGSYELSSSTSVDAVVTFRNGEFAAVSKAGLLNVQTPQGVVTPIESGSAFVFNSESAESVDVQAAGGDVHEHESKSGEVTSHAHDNGLVDHSHGSGYFTVNNGLIVGGLVIGTALLSGTFSDGDDADEVASPAQ